MTPILETERLVFHPFTPADMPLLVELHGDPEVQRYIGGLWPADAYERRLAQYVADQAAYGVSKWKAHLRDGTFVGRAGVSFWEVTGFELGYSFKQAAWGQGLATEAAHGIVDWTWANTDIDRLCGFTELANRASQRVLEKVGMVYEGERDLGFGEAPSAVYWLCRPT
jgi:ribosomal-protein-alanine N-acetyltransferase